MNIRGEERNTPQINNCPPRWFTASILTVMTTIVLFLAAQAIVGLTWGGRVDTRVNNNREHIDSLEARINIMDQQGTRGASVLLERILGADRATQNDVQRLQKAIEDHERAARERSGRSGNERP